MTRINQILAVEQGVKNKALTDLTEAHRSVGKSPLLSGISRSYAPKDEEGDRLPPESTLVQLNVEDVLKTTAANLVRLFDVTLTKDAGNQTAKADIIVGGWTLLEAVPVTYLLFLEKQLVNIHTFVQALPVLDPAEPWASDTATGVWATNPVQTVRTKKVPRNWVKAEATDKHPAQVDTYNEDVVVGYWTTRKFSGALPADRVRQLTDRVEELQRAVKLAREEANSATVEDLKAGQVIFDHLFA